MWDDNARPDVPSLKQLRNSLASFIERKDRRSDFTLKLCKMGLLDFPELGGAIGVTPLGHELYKHEKIDLTDGTAIWANAVASWRPCQVVLDTFQGRTGVSPKQVGSALSLHGESKYGGRSEATRIAALLCQVGLATKRRSVYTFAASHGTRTSMRTTITPETPFGNRLALDQIFEGLGPDVCWYERHGTKKHLTTLYENLNQGQHTSVRLLVSKINDTKSEFLDRARDLAEELQTIRGIKVEVRQLQNRSRANPHDRYLGDGETWWNVPPINTWLGPGDHSDLSRVTICPFDEWWSLAGILLE